ncbi:MAG: fasciclin domain-containing protein [Prevotella sp.]|nr:fasciclin domain-containing protein [Prevotella sp.]
MKQQHLVPLRWSVSFIGLLALTGGLTSCSDDYEYEQHEPDFLGASIYDYLQQQGDFKTYLQLVDDLDYKQVLSLTGSKTVFPARDEAWTRFFSGDNPWGVTSYEQLTAAQKRSLLGASTINMAYLTYMLANTGDSESQSGEGTALRRATQYSYLDSIQWCQDARQLAAPFWQKYQQTGVRLADQGDTYMVHFTPQHTAANQLAVADLSLILGKAYDAKDVYVNGTQVVEKDITCKNGYVHVVQEVLTPNSPMSEVINHHPQTQLFSRLMERFSAPYYNSAATDAVHQLYDGRDKAHPVISDSIFVKRYFTESQPSDPEGNDMTHYGLLYIDPSQNTYQSMQDMGVMFVPTDEAMQNYLNGGKGAYLKDAYGTWDEVPTSLVALFVKNHQKKSFMSSLPSSWSTMNDEASFAMHVDQKDVVATYVTGNGVVYVTNKVYPPIDYQSVYAPVMTNRNTRIMNWALQDHEMKFFLYLRSMENMYNLLVPTDEALQNYRDPIAWAKGKSQRQIWAFRYDETKDQPVTADVYAVNDDGTKGEFQYTISDVGLLRNRLYDICDRHIIVGMKDEQGNMSGYVDDGTHHYYQSKGGSTLRFSGAGEQMTATGGGDTEQQVADAHQIRRYDTDNGRCYIVDRVLQDPVNSVYTNLQAHAEYAKFFELLNGDDMVFRTFQNDPEIKSIFTLNRTSSSSGLGNVVSSFANFQYTVLVPTNDAVDAAFAADPTLHTWSEIAQQTDVDVQRQWAVRLIRFLQYHFIDNSTYVDSRPFAALTFETAARSNSGRFQKISVSGDGQNLTFTDAQGHRAHVVKTPGLYNLQSRDFIVNNSDYRNATQMVSSSQSVIHLIDRALIPE